MRDRRDDRKQLKMLNPFIQPRNLTVTGLSTFSIDFEITIGEERIRSIAGGGAIDGYDYLMVSDPTGKAREFSFDFSELKKTIGPTNTINVVVRIMDVDDNLFEWGFSKNYATENGLPSISNPRISQRTDGSRLVDIEYDYQSPNEIDPAVVAVLLSLDWGKTWVTPVDSLSGDFGSGIAVGPNRKATWNPSGFLKDTPIEARIGLVNADGMSAVGAYRTGTIIVSPKESGVPIVSIQTAAEQKRFGKRFGNLYKNASIEFEPIESSSESSVSSSSVSSISSSSISSSSFSSVSSLSSPMENMSFWGDEYNYSGCGLQVYNNSLCTLRSGFVSIQRIILNYPIDQGEWYHVAQLFSGSGTYTYVNGSPVGPGGSVINKGTIPFQIGRSSNGSFGVQHLNGNVDEFRIYNRSLSGTELHSLYTNSSPPTSGLVVYYSFDNDTLNDSSGNGNNGLAIGSISFTTGVLGRACQVTSGSFVQVPINPDINYTVSGWIRAL